MIACFEYCNLLLFMERKHIYLANNNANKRCQHKICVCIYHYEFVYRKLSYALPYIFRQICPSLPNRHHSFSLLLHVFFFHLTNYFILHTFTYCLFLWNIHETWKLLLFLFHIHFHLLGIFSAKLNIKFIRNKTYFF